MALSIISNSNFGHLEPKKLSLIKFYGVIYFIHFKDIPPASHIVEKSRLTSLPLPLGPILSSAHAHSFPAFIFMNRLYIICSILLVYLI